MKECRRRQGWYIFETKSDEKKEELVCGRHIKPVGVYIRRHVALLAWCGAFVKILKDKREYHRWVKAIKCHQIYIEMCNAVSKRMLKEDC